MISVWFDKLPWPARFPAYVWQQFLADRCPRAAASLAYTTLLSLVPLLAMLFVFLSALPIFQSLGLQSQIEDFLFSNFVPAFGATIQSHLHEFRNKATGLGAVGFGVLFITVLMLLATVESAFNAIWRARRKRRRVLQLLTYWALLTLGPLLIGTGFAVSSYLVSLPLFTEVESSLALQGNFLAIVPFLLTFLAFLLVYKLIPNRPVPISHALGGSAFASILFEFAKRGFTYYITHFPTQEAIYGAFASIPIFLLWIYLCWVIVLLGAEITRSLTTFPNESHNRAIPALDSDFVDACRIIARLVEAQKSGRSCSERELLKLEPAVKHSRLDHILDCLADAKWLVSTDSGKWVLARNAEQETLLGLYRIVPGPLPVVVSSEQFSKADQDLLVNLAGATDAIRDRLGLTLAELKPRS